MKSLNKLQEAVSNIAINAKKQDQQFYHIYREHLQIR